MANAIRTKWLDMAFGDVQTAIEAIEAGDWLHADTMLALAREMIDAADALAPMKARKRPEQGEAMSPVFTVTTSSDDWDTIFRVGAYATMEEAEDVARGHELHHDAEARITERVVTAAGVVTVPHYDL